jgi:hypothetical protein
VCVHHILGTPVVLLGYYLMAQLFFLRLVVSPATSAEYVATY